MTADSPAVVPSTTWVRGELVAGRYRLVRSLGSGGSARVWAARDESLGREVAIKALTGRGVQGGRECERLRREARILAGLRHPMITTVFDLAESVDEEGGEHPFLVAELLDGESLNARLARGPLALSEALTVCGQVADALASAHESGVVHRDVKPGNVMLASRGAVLLDFGISRREADAELTGQLVVGTPACMAPEQWRGSGAQPASDVYALGCLLYWCLSGHPPYPGRELPALGVAHLMDDPPDLPPTGRHHAEVDALYRACVRKDPVDRPSAREVADALERIETSASGATGIGNPTLAIERPHRRAWYTAYIASGSALLAALIVVPLTLADRSRAAPVSTGVSSSVSSAPSTVGIPTNAGEVAVNATQAPSHTPAPPAAPAETHGGANGHHHGHGKHGGS